MLEQEGKFHHSGVNVIIILIIMTLFWGSKKHFEQLLCPTVSAKNKPRRQSGINQSGRGQRGRRKAFLSDRCEC